jgi:hypothetical protein
LESTADTALEDWFGGPLGARVLREEAALATLALDTVFGFELLQVGAWGPARHLLTAARTQHTTLLAPELTPGVTLCRSDPIPSTRFCCLIHSNWSKTPMPCCAKLSEC